VAEKKLTVERAYEEFKVWYQAKRKRIERQIEDFRFVFGEQWTAEEKDKLRSAGIDPYVDNRVQPNVHLLTGLERQNRTDFRAYPRGDEDGVKAEIATLLFKDVIEKSEFNAKSSDQFKDGVICGESYLELYLDNTESLINGSPKWCKVDTDQVIPDPASKEYDFSDARAVYKLKTAIELEDLVNMFPDKRRQITKLGSGRLDVETLVGNGDRLQKRNYGRIGEKSEGAQGDREDSDGLFDLIERYYKKWIRKVFIGDRKTGEIIESEDLDTAEAFVADYQSGIQRDQDAYEQAVQQMVAQALPAMEMAAQAQAMAALPPQAPAPVDGENIPPIQMVDPSHVRAALEESGQLPPPPPQQDPERFVIIRRSVPEIWCFSFISGMDQPLANKRAWFYPKWRAYPFIPYFARFSTAPLTGDDRHLLVQGIVHGVKGPQVKHNKSEILLIRHLNGSTNSGWLTEEGVWADQEKVEQFGTRPGINLEYKKGSQTPERIAPAPLSQGHVQMAAESVEAIKGILGINSDLIAAQAGGGDSGRAIALRQKQGLLMVQELYDNLTRTRKLAGRFMLSQLGEVYDTESAMKVLGEAWLTKTFPPQMLPDPDQMGQMMPMPNADGSPPGPYDKMSAETEIAAVLRGDLEQYDVIVGESVASDTQRAAVAMEMKDLSTAMPGVIPPDVVIRNSQLPESAKREILAAYERAQAAAAAAMPPGRQEPPREEANGER